MALEGVYIIIAKEEEGKAGNTRPGAVFTVEDDRVLLRKPGLLRPDLIE